MTLSPEFIETEYRRRGFELGWRFLTCPEKNIGAATVALVTINPGGGVFEPGRWSVEDGSAYVIERWKGCPPGQENLQRQVTRMFELMTVDPKDVLSGYLVPFRSPNWDELPKKSEALTFGEGLWREVFAQSPVKTVICFGKDTAPYLSKVLDGRLSTNVPAGWGDQTIDVYRFGEVGKLIVLPHLSRFGLFGREPSEAAFCAALGEAEPENGVVATTITKAINWAYDRVIEDGFPGLPGAERLANEYSAQSEDVEAAIDSLIKWQTLNAGTAGFITGLGGFLTLPVTLPANLASVLYLQIRMIAAIAHLRGHDIKSDKIRTLVFACLVGSSVTDILKDFGIQVGTKLSQKAIQQISGATLVKINQAVGFRLVTKAGSTGAVNLTKFVPFVGGVVSGGFDAGTTYAIGSAAKNLFNSVPQGIEA